MVGMNRSAWKAFIISWSRPAVASVQLEQGVDYLLGKSLRRRCRRGRGLITQW